MDSSLSGSLMISGITLSVATSAVTTMMTAYKLWYDVLGGIHSIQWRTIEVIF